MEARQTPRIIDKEQRNKTLSPARGGSPVAGLLVFGGALAVTGLIAVASFVNKRSQAKLPSQDSTTDHHNACYEISNTTKDQVLSCESLPSQTSTLEHKPDLKVKTCVEEEIATSLHQEIVLSDDSPPESTLSLNDNEIEEEGLESSVDSPCFEEVAQSEPQEPKSVEINEGQFDNDSATTETEDDIVEEEDDVAFDTSENSSEATGRTSLDSSDAAIWPAELIEEEPQQVKGEMVNDQSEAEGTAEANIARTYDKSHSNADSSEFSGYAWNDRVMASAKASSHEKPYLYATLNYHLSAPKFKTWAILLLLFAILLPVLLSHRRFFNDGNSVISP